MELNGFSDAELIRRVAAHDEAAFEALYDRHSPRAFGLALRVTGTRSAAEEVVQDAFLSVWSKAARYDPDRGSVPSWLLSMVRNRGIDALRKGGRRARDIELDAAIAAGFSSDERTDEIAEHRDEAGRTRALLARLPDEQRQVVELAFYAGMTHAEIAVRVGIPLGTVKGRSRLALEKLHDAMTASPAFASAR